MIVAAQPYKKGLKELRFFLGASFSTLGCSFAGFVGSSTCTVVLLTAGTALGISSLTIFTTAPSEKHLLARDNKLLFERFLLTKAILEIQRRLFIEFRKLFEVSGNPARTSGLSGLSGTNKNNPISFEIIDIAYIT